MRGDVGLMLEFALGATLFLFRHTIQGAAVGNAIKFAFNMVAVHYLSLAAATVAWRLSPFHPLAKYPG